MKLSTRGHYGMHAVMDLAVRYGQGPVLLRDLCELHAFSEKYLEQLLRALRQAGIVESVRGAKGGYWLAKPPDKITILEIIEILEGDLHQLPSGCDSDCIKNEHCAMLECWYDATEATRDILGKRTLQDMIIRQREMDNKQSGSNYII